MSWQDAGAFMAGIRAVCRVTDLSVSVHYVGRTLSPANRHDSMMLAPTLDTVPGVRHGRGRPRKRSNKLHADNAYDHHRCRSECRKRRVTPRIARRGMDSSERLGPYRWVVEGTLPWLNRFRRLADNSDYPCPVNPALADRKGPARLAAA